ncbi:hypothetical protein Tsubulata_039302 [Turnera subulata]|uniref:Uncharacterized protein n=1 Tax=Turnera subulata TaxID=218843 RepID=A0A9Q0JDJ0_9ROSI|nr:hypothetical protein Tsubulata_039302 [Turnera subulata]
MSPRHLNKIAYRLTGKAEYASSTSPKPRAYPGPGADFGYLDLVDNKGKRRSIPISGEYVPVFVALGLIIMQVSLGIVTVKQHLLHSPQVRVKKKLRETVPEYFHGHSRRDIYAHLPRVETLKDGYWKSMAARLKGNATYATSTSPKMKPYAPTADNMGNLKQENRMKKMMKGDYVPVYVVLGMIAVSLSLGLYTVNHQLFHSPNVRVKKKTRETLPELEEPEKVVDEADKFVKKSFFRKVAHVQDFDGGMQNIRNPAHKDVYAHDKPRYETLSSVGVDAKNN